MLLQQMVYEGDKDFEDKNLASKKLDSNVTAQVGRILPPQSHFQNVSGFQQFQPHQQDGQSQDLQAQGSSNAATNQNPGTHFARVASSDMMLNLNVPHLPNMSNMQNLQNGASSGPLFDFAFEDMENGENAHNGNHLLNLPFLSSFRSVGAQQPNLIPQLAANTNSTTTSNQNDTDHHMQASKEEAELALEFQDSCSVQFNPLSQRSVDFTDLHLVQGNPNLPGLSNALHQNNGVPKMELEHIGSQRDNSNHKRKSIELGLNLFSSRRTLGSSIRSQSKNLFNTLAKPFRKSSKKKSRRDKSETITTSCSNESKRSQKSETSKASKTSKKSAKSNDNENSVLNFEGGKHYSRIENVVLVGEIYTQLFINPALKKQTWVVIAKNFEKFFQENPNQQQTCVRTSGALERHFKVLKEQNRKEGGTMFAELYEEYKAFHKLKK